MHFIYEPLFINRSISSDEERDKCKNAAEYELSTRFIPTPRSFLLLSAMAGCLNSGTAYLRFRRIYFLEIPILLWLQSAITSEEELLEFLEARWIVAINDWTSLLLAITFSLAACINFATLRQLWLAFKDQQEERMLLPDRGCGFGDL